MQSLLKMLLSPISIAAILSSGEAVALDCSKAFTTPDMNECARIEQEKVEAELNATYKRALAFLDGRDPPIKEDAARAKAKLIEAQRAWITFRESDCEAVYSLNSSGTIRTLMWIGCMRSRAEQRIKELNRLMDGDD